MLGDLPLTPLTFRKPSSLQTMTVIERAKQKVIQELLDQIDAYDCAASLSPGDIYRRISLLERIERILTH